MNVPSYAEFASRIDTGFVMQSPGGGQIPLVLTDCAGTPDAFSLSFKGGPESPRKQGLYQLSADGLGPEVVFLVPVALRPHDSDFPLEYQPIFNHSPTPEGST